MVTSEINLSWLEEQGEDIQSSSSDLEIYEITELSLNKEDCMSDVAFGRWEIEREGDGWEPSLFILTEIDLD